MFTEFINLAAFTFAGDTRGVLVCLPLDPVYRKLRGINTEINKRQQPPLQARLSSIHPHWTLPLPQSGFWKRPLKKQLATSGHSTLEKTATQKWSGAKLSTPWSHSVLPRLSCIPKQERSQDHRHAHWSRSAGMLCHTSYIVQLSSKHDAYIVYMMLNMLLSRSITVGCVTLCSILYTVPSSHFPPAMHMCLLLVWYKQLFLVTVQVFHYLYEKYPEKQLFPIVCSTEAYYRKLNIVFRQCFSIFVFRVSVTVKVCTVWSSFTVWSLPWSLFLKSKS